MGSTVHVELNALHSSHKQYANSKEATTTKAKSTRSKMRRMHQSKFKAKQPFKFKQSNPKAKAKNQKQFNSSSSSVIGGIYHHLSGIISASVHHRLSSFVIGERYIEIGGSHLPITLSKHRRHRRHHQRSNYYHRRLQTLKRIYHGGAEVQE